MRLYATLLKRIEGVEGATLGFRNFTAKEAAKEPDGHIN
jgi:hypothetical protein